MELKRKRILKWELMGFLFTVFFGTIYHFFYEIIGFMYTLAWLFPVNESPWEHLKLFFYPMFFWTMIQYAFSTRYKYLSPSGSDGVNNYWFARLVGFSIATTFIG